VAAWVHKRRSARAEGEARATLLPGSLWVKGGRPTMAEGEDALDEGRGEEMTPAPGEKKVHQAGSNEAEARVREDSAMGGVSQRKGGYGRVKGTQPGTVVGESPIVK